jgi:hypothetical protein
VLGQKRGNESTIGALEWSQISVEQLRLGTRALPGMWQVCVISEFTEGSIVIYCEDWRGIGEHGVRKQRSDSRGGFDGADEEILEVRRGRMGEDSGGGLL